MNKIPHPYSDNRIMVHNFMRFFLPMAFAISLMYLGNLFANIVSIACVGAWPYFYRSLKVISDDQYELLQRLAFLEPLLVRPFLNEIDQRHRAIFHGEYARLTRWFLEYRANASDSCDTEDSLRQG